MGDEPIWAAYRVVALTPGSAITIPKTTNEFAIKGNHLILVKGNQFDDRTKTYPHKHIHEFLRICDMFKYRDTKNEAVRLMMFPLSLTGEYKELQSHAKQPTPDLDDDDMPMSREEEAKFMQTFLAKNHQASIQNLETKFDRLADKQSGRPSRSLPSNTQPNPRGGNSKAYQPSQAQNEHRNAIFTRSGKSYNPPDNLNDQQNNSKNPINFNSDDEDDEQTPQPKTKTSKPVKETPLPKTYKPKISYPLLIPLE
ncbi:hypothetical protein Tco_1319072 [Tanacetum coccineum]